MPPIEIPSHFIPIGPSYVQHAIDYAIYAGAVKETVHLGKGAVKLIKYAIKKGGA